MGLVGGAGSALRLCGKLDPLSCVSVSLRHRVETDATVGWRGHARELKAPGGEGPADRSRSMSMWQFSWETLGVATRLIGTGVVRYQYS